MEDDDHLSPNAESSEEESQHLIPTQGIYDAVFVKSYQDIMFAFKALPKTTYKVLFSQEFVPYCIVIVSIMIPFIIYNFSASIKSISATTTNIPSIQILMFLVFMLGAAFAWGILNVIHVYIFRFEFVQFQNTNEMNYYNSVVFQPLFMICILNSSKVLSSGFSFNSYMWVFMSVIHDFIYYYSDYLYNFTIEKCAKVVIIEDLIILKSKVINEVLVLVSLNIGYTYFIFNFSFEELDFVIIYAFLIKGLYLLFIQLELLISIWESYHQLLGSFIRDDKRYLQSMKLKCALSFINYLFLLTFLVYIWDAITNFGQSVSTLVALYLMLLHYRCMKRTINIFIVYFKTRNFFREFEKK